MTNPPSPVPRPLSPFEAILFDFDGVLLDSEPIHFDCWQQVLAPLGANLDWDTYAAHCIGISDRAMVEMLAGRSSPPVDVELLWAQYPAKKRLFRDRMRAAAPFAPGLADFLRELSADYKLAVVSSSGRMEVEPLLERGGLLPYLGALVCHEDVERLKPAPDPYLRAASLLGVKTALVVEDSEAGLESARAAGFPALRITDASQVISSVRAAIRGPAT